MKESCFLNKRQLLHIVSLEKYATKTSCIYPKAEQMGVSPSGDKKHPQCYSRTCPFSFSTEAGAVLLHLLTLPGAFPSWQIEQLQNSNNYKDQEQSELRKKTNLKNSHFNKAQEKKYFNSRNFSWDFLYLFTNYRKKTFVFQVSTVS